MNIISLIGGKILSFLLTQKDNQLKNEYIRGIDRSYNKLSSKKDLTPDQELEIKNFYKKFNYLDIPLSWHKYFTSRLNIFSPIYVPTSLYKTDIVGRLNIFPLKRAYTDKNISDVILPSSIQPRIILKNMNGYYYYGGEPVSKEEALKRCENIGKVIIKPSLTGRGVGVQRIHIEAGKNMINNESLASIFEEYKTDFLIQEIVEQHELMEKLNPSSVNTIRILTYRSGMDIKVVYTVIRIGRKGKTIDNESAGGISARINSDGRIAKYAYGAPGVDNVEYTDNNVLLEGYLVPSFSKAIELVKRQHYNLPYFDLIGWDIAISKSGEPILIEFNMTPDLSQSANGPAFGEYTELILSDAAKRKNTWSWIAQKCMWKKNV